MKRHLVYNYPINLFFLLDVLNSLALKRSSQIYNIASAMGIRYTNMTKLRKYLQFLEEYEFLQLYISPGSKALYYALTADGKRFRKEIKAEARLAKRR